MNVVSIDPKTLCPSSAAIRHVAARRCYRLPNWLIVLVVLLLASVVAERAKAAAPPVSAAIVLVQ
jgi:hypothetical protein